MQQSVKPSADIVLDFTGLFSEAQAPEKQQASGKAAAQPSRKGDDEESLLKQGYKLVDYEETPFFSQGCAQTASKPPRSDSASQTKESKPSALQASEAVTRPQKKPLLDSTGTIDYSKLERENHEFLARHNPPPIDEAYYAGCTTMEQLLTTRSPAEIAYWEQVEADRDAILLRHDNDEFITGLLAASWNALSKDYERLLLECLKEKIDALDQQI